MTYRNSYRRSVQRTAPRANIYDGKCWICQGTVPAHAGILTGNRDVGYRIRHGDRHWMGSPISGRFVGGCPDSSEGKVT